MTFPPISSIWHRQWFGPVAAVRPYLFQKCFVLLVAFDAIVLMIERGSRYGVDNIPFNVAHFGWLDSLHARFLPHGVPTATYYVSVIALVSFLALLLFFMGQRPWLTAILATLYTYGWSMSRLDSYLHHYMISLILACMIFFPRVEPDTVLRWMSQDPKGDREGKRNYWSLALGLALIALCYRILLSHAVGLSLSQRWGAMFLCAGIVAVLIWRFQRELPAGNGPFISAWSFRLLGTTVGVIYVFTAIAKMDSEWCGGHTLRKVGATESVLRPIEQLVGGMGIPADLFWAGLATFVIPLELVLAISYLLAVWQDVPHRVWLRRWCLFAWVLAVGLHLNNEMMNLVIQWFGYHMLFLATLILLPSRALLPLATLFLWPEVHIGSRFRSYVGGLSNGQAMLLLGLAAFVTLFVIVLSGFFMAVPGTALAMCLVACLMVVLLIYGMLRGWERQSLGLTLCFCGAALLMIVATAQCSMRFDYFDLRGKTLQQLGQQQQALAEMQKATFFSAPSNAAAAELHVNLGLAHRQLGQSGEAEASYRKALQLDPTAILSHYNFANFLTENERYKEAEYHYRQAVAIKPDFSDAYVNLGNLLEFNGRIDEAIESYRAALAVEPQASDVRQLLQSATMRRKQGTADR